MVRVRAAECDRLGGGQVIAAKKVQLRLASLSAGDAEALTIQVEKFFGACDALMRKRLCANYQLEVRPFVSHRHAAFSHC